jgi:hypothetical protein
MDLEPISVNYVAVAAGAVISMVVGALWYGPIFGKKWMEIIGINPESTVQRREMQKGVGVLYAIQFVLTLFQILVLAHFIADTVRVTGIERALWIWAAFIVPTLAGSVMWTNEKSRLKWARFLIQGGYQLVMFVTYGLLLHFWK